MMSQPPPDRPPAVTVAPNESNVLAKVIHVERSPQWPDKWLLEIEINASDSVRGPQMAKPGQRMQAFAFASDPPAHQSDRIRARAEYIGDARGGQLRLSDVTVQQNPSMVNQSMLHGIIQFAGKQPDFESAQAHVMIEDVTHADRSSVVVAQETVDVWPGQGNGSFALSVEPLEPGRSYSVRVHIDVDGDGSVSPGDYVTTQAYLVTRDSTALTVTVQEV